MTATTECLGVYKATYDYAAQGDDEVTIKEDQILFLLDASDDEWSKVRVKTSQDEESPEGLVPAAYIEEAQPISTVKALYDYEANASGELSIAEDQVLSAYDKEEDWILVKTEQSGKIYIGYVPGNYVEDVAESATASVPTPVIVPDSPPRPAYVDPAERSAAATSDKARQDPIDTWGVHLIDAKGKKKKGTLGIGNGAIFFASESDKGPVQKWQTSDIASVSVDKKHIKIDFNGDIAPSLHFAAKDLVEAISKKLELSRRLWAPQLNGDTDITPRPSTDSRAITSLGNGRAADVIMTKKTSESGKSVHFAAAHAEIPPRPATPDEEEVVDEGEETGVALYDFTGDASDELSVKEGEMLVIIDRSNDDWWKCRNQAGEEGVVPAEYIDLESMERNNQVPQSPVEEQIDSEERLNRESAEEASKKAAAEEKRRAREREERERKAQERAEREREQARQEEEEQRAKALDEERASVERQRAEEAKAKATAAAKIRKQQREAEIIRKKKEEERARERASSSQDDPDDDDEDALAEKARQLVLRKQMEADKQRQGQGSTRPTSGHIQGPPPTGKTRIWHDRSGQFRVEAEFKGYENGKIRLHKINGVTIEVPSERMSPEDMAYISKITRSRGSKTSNVIDDDNAPLANISRSSSRPSNGPDIRVPVAPKPKSHIDWFEFFLNAGCDMDDATRYTSAFERDKIDEQVIPHMKSDTLRALGLREGDIIRVMTAIETKKWKSRTRLEEPGVKDQIRADEEFAQQLQDAEYFGKKAPTGPGPIPKPKSVEPARNLFANANGALKAPQRRGRPTPAGRVPSLNVDENTIANASGQLAQRSSPSPNTLSQGRSSSPQLLNIDSPASNVSSGFEDEAWTPRPSSTKPTATPPIIPAGAAKTTPTPPQPTPPPTIVEPAQPTTTFAAPSAKSTTELDLLEKIASLRRPASATVPSSSVAQSPPLAAVSPVSPASVPPAMTYNPNLPRGPFAPVPANQSVLLKPLIPTTTGLTGFVPTRPASTSSPFTNQPLLSAGPTSFNSPLTSQSTGYLGTMPMMVQPTGVGFAFTNNQINIPPVPPLPIQTHMTAVPFGNTGVNNFALPVTPIPPVPPVPIIPPLQQSQPTQNHSPANVFASMKSGNFGEEQNSNADKYGPLRPNSVPNPAMHPTAWVPGMQTGYQNYPSF